MKAPVLAALVASLTFARFSAGATTVTVLDDGEKIARDAFRPTPGEPWRAPDGSVDLFAMRGEVVAVQVVVEARGQAEEGVDLAIGALCSDRGACLDVAIDTFAERFVDVQRATGNDRGGDSLAFTAAAAPSPGTLTGELADALVPVAVAGETRVAAGQRGAFWIDLTVSERAAPGVYRGAILVRSHSRELAARRLTLRVLDASMPYAAAKATVYYERSTLVRRMGDAAAPRAEEELRALLHAHHLSAIRDVTSADDAMRELDALRGTAFTRARGYAGPGEGAGEGVFAIGAYGSLGTPTPATAAAAGTIASMLRDAGILSRTQTFIYAVDEDCDSAWPREWSTLVRRTPSLDGVRVGATCGVNPTAQAASLVMMTAADLFPQRARVARAAPGAKWVWAYNGRRPYAGPMMLDVPATDLRANAWIALRYGIERWFYWEATYWLDSNPGGLGGGVGLDPFTAAETFHDAAGDHAEGDGVLVYPGTQRLAGAVDYGLATVFPSVRLKNLRRGIEDAGYVALARAVDRARADAIVRRTVPRALAVAGDRPAWPERGAAWIEARRALAATITEPPPRAREEEPVPEGETSRFMSQGCGVALRGDGASGAPWALLLLWWGGARRRRASVRRDGGTGETMSRKRYEPSQTPTLRIAAVRAQATAKTLPRAPIDVDAAERETQPGPPPTVDAEPRLPRHVEGRISGLRPRKRGSIPVSAVVDEVTADLSKDPRHDDD